MILGKESSLSLPRLFLPDDPPAANPRGIPVSLAARSCYSPFMKNVLWMVLAGFLALGASGCREEARLTILFTGDERGWIVPAG